MPNNNNSPYAYEYALEKSVNYFNGDNLAAETFIHKYALRDRDGELLECIPTDMHKRIAKEFARIEQKYENPLSEKEIFDYLDSWTIVPQGSPMSSIGNVCRTQSLSNCFVIAPPYDSYGGIFKTDQEMAQLMKRRGGVGTDCSTIRPKGMRTNNSAGTTDGIAVFCERFSNTCREVAQNGRRGALMISCDVEHPEIETFISMKKDLKKVTGANVSIKVSDAFMEAVEKNEDFVLRWPTDVVPNLAKFTKTVNAKEIWDSIVMAAWQSAEPGVLFWDTYLRDTPSDCYVDFGFKTITTNPCGELGMCADDSCRLLLVNLIKFIRNAFTKDAYFDEVEYRKVCMVAQRLMDDLVDLEIEACEKIIAKINADPEPQEVKAIEIDLWKRITLKAVNGRRTGTGITALGDAIAFMGYRYGSTESIEFTEKVYSCLTTSCYKASIDLAKERNPFPIFDFSLEKDHTYLNRVIQAADAHYGDSTLADWRDYGRRNIALTTTAPAGSVSILTQTSSGFEPVFMMSYKRRKRIAVTDSTIPDFVDDMGDKWSEFTVRHHGLTKWMEVTGLTDESLSPYANSCANDIDWSAKIDMQAVAQKWICHSISNTLNLPKDVSVETVDDAYFKAWKTGCKGITVYRDGSRAGVLISTEPKATINNISLTNAPKRPREMECDIHRASVGGEPYLILVGLMNGLPYEIFAGLSEMVEVPKKIKSGFLVKDGKKDSVAIYNLRIPINDDDEIVYKNVVELFANPNYSAFGRTISLALRHGAPVNYLVEQLRKDKYSDLTSFSRVVARVLSKSYIANGTKSLVEKKCDECGGINIAYQDGCITCMDCGSSKCG